MGVPSRDALEQRRRVLEYQAKKAAEAPRPKAEPADLQRKIPLVGEARRPPEPEPKRQNKWSRRAAQLKLGEL
jgi:hypothetical protein